MSADDRLTVTRVLVTMGAIDTFQSWCDARPHGVLRAVADKTGLSYSTVRRVYAGQPAGPKVARLLSAATGGDVTVETLRGGA